MNAKIILTDGCIPAGKECPFKNKCELANSLACLHDLKNKRPFSCGAARGFEIVQKNIS